MTRRGDPVDVQISAAEPDGELEERGNLVIAGHQAAARAAERHGHTKLAALHNGIAADAVKRLEELIGPKKEKQQ